MQCIHILIYSDPPVILGGLFVPHDHADSFQLTTSVIFLPQISLWLKEQPVRYHPWRVEASLGL